MPVFTWAPSRAPTTTSSRWPPTRASTRRRERQASRRRTPRRRSPTSLINGTYYWRLRSITPPRTTSAWTKARTVALKWAPVTNITGPARRRLVHHARDAARRRADPALGADGRRGAVRRHDRHRPAPDHARERRRQPRGHRRDRVHASTAPSRTASTTGASRRSTPRATRAFLADALVHRALERLRRLAGRHRSGDRPRADGSALLWGTVLGASNYEIEISTSSDFAAGLQGRRRDDDRDVALADRPLPGQHLLLARAALRRLRTTPARGRSAHRSPRRSTTCRRSTAPVGQEHPHARHERHRQHVLA